MSQTFLDKMIAQTRREIERRKASSGIDELASAAHAVRDLEKEHRFHRALSQRDRVNVIAEIKRASPSKGVINDHIDIRELAREYERGGAAAISVLTEAEYFGGSLDDLRAVRATVDLPILRKAFIVDEYQIHEAAQAGADAILLIVAALNESELLCFRRLAEEHLGMDAIVEVHSESELAVAERIRAKIIGVNNRDLKSFAVSLDVSRQLIARRSSDALMIAESGLSSRDEIDELRALGYDAFLVGETLMRQPEMLANLVGGAT